MNVTASIDEILLRDAAVIWTESSGIESGKNENRHNLNYRNIAT